MNKILLLITSIMFTTSIVFPQSWKYELDERDGLYYKENSKTPFSGTNFSYWDNGKIRNKIVFKKGLRYKLSMQNKNGKKIYEDIIKNNIREETEWYENGKKKNHESFLLQEEGSSIKTGKWTYWYENGQKKSEETFKDGKRDGLHTTWYQDGRKESEEKYVDGSTDCSFESFGGEELVVNKVITQIVKGVKNYSMERYMESGIKSYPNNPFEASYELPECYIETNESRKDGYWWFSNDTIHYGLKYKWIYDSDSGTITKL